MLDVPSFLFYAATISLIIVCGFIAVLLFYLIIALRTARALLVRIEGEARRMRARLETVRGAFALVEDFLGRWAHYER